MGLVNDCRLIGLRDDAASAEALTPAILDPLANVLYRFGKFDQPQQFRWHGLGWSGRRRFSFSPLRLTILVDMCSIDFREAQDGREPPAIPTLHT